MKFFKYLLLGALVSVAAALIWYFAYWARTPQYTIGLISSAIQKHDYPAFARYVDMEAFYGSAYDDVVAVSFGRERLASPILSALVKNIKGIAVPILIKQTRHYVEGSDDIAAAAPEAADPAAADNGTAIVNSLKNKTGIANLQYQGIENIRIDGDNAVVTIKTFDRRLTKHFLVELAMRRQDGGRWQLTRAENLQQLIRERDQTIKSRLSELNKPLLEQIAAAAAITPQKIFTVSAPHSALIRLLEADLLLTNKGSKDINYFTGQMEIFNEEGKLIYSGTFASSKPLPAAKTAIYKFNWELNPYLTDDTKVLNSDFSKLTWQATLNGLIFADASKIELFTELPPKKP